MMITRGRRAETASTVALLAFLCYPFPTVAKSVSTDVSTPLVHADIPEPLLVAETRTQPPAPKKSITSPIEEATLNPQIYIPPPKDLQLGEANSARADAVAHYVEGLSLEESGEPAKALAAFLKSLQLDPTNIQLATHVALSMARKGQVTEAIGILKDCAKAAPNASAPQVALAYFYLRYLRKPEAAEPYASKALALDPSEPRAYAYLVEIYLVRGQDKKAEAILEKALNSKSKDPDFWVGLGDLYRRIFIPEDQPPTDAAIKKVSRFYEKAAQMDASNPRVLNQLANFYSLTHQIGKAIPLYLRVLELSPAEEDLLTSVQENLALSYKQNKEPAKAIEVLEKVVKESPQRRFAYELLGDLYESQEDYKNALKNYEQCLNLSPNSPRQYERVAGLLLDRLQDSKRALEVIAAARKQFPDLPYFTFLQALAFRVDKKFDDSLNSFAEAEKEAKTNAADILSGSFYYQYGISAEMGGKPAVAATLFKKAIELDPSNPNAYNYLGYMWVDRNENLDEAGELIKRAVEMKPTEPSYLDSLGWYYYRIGNFGRALSELLRACELLPEPDPIVLDHVAEAYDKLGNNSQAINFWEQAIKLDPKNKSISDKLEASKKKLSRN